MSNYVFSRITIQGQLEELKKFYTRCGGKFHFNAFLPRPKGLEKSEAQGVHLGNEAAIFVWNQDHPLDDKPPQKIIDEIEDYNRCWEEVLADSKRRYRKIVENPETASRGADFIALGTKVLKNINEYGANTLTHWCFNNWGIGWDVENSCFSALFEDPNVPGNGIVRISFAVTGDFPIPGFEAISKQYPSLTFDGVFADEAIGDNCGEIKIKNGNTVFTDRTGDIVFACEVRGIDPEIVLG